MGLSTIYPQGFHTVAGLSTDRGLRPRDPPYMVWEGQGHQYVLSPGAVCLEEALQPGLQVTQPWREYFVYAVLWQPEEGPGAIKIGYSGYIGRRLPSLARQWGNEAKMFAIVEAGWDQEAAKALEAEFHREFADRALGQEWFRFDFQQDEEKRAFNDGSSRVLARFHGSRDVWWTKLSRKAVTEGGWETMKKGGWQQAHQSKTRTAP